LPRGAPPTATPRSSSVCVVDKFWQAAPPELLPEGAADAAGGAAAKGPILFYTGNESPVEVYINNTGLMWDLAPKLNALLVFAEHRYEGESFPQLQGGPPHPQPPPSEPPPCEPPGCPSCPLRER